MGGARELQERGWGGVGMWETKEGEEQEGETRGGGDLGYVLRAVVRVLLTADNVRRCGSQKERLRDTEQPRACGRRRHNGLLPSSLGRTDTSIVFGVEADCSWVVG
ncbi:hypothetical protein E2C01_013022 [Portunus trituberculatus]|uniref:Uncharacterized protein n=1 Tax=Portunus trituberculatus TaxID=210409 RepID=A0A5B7DF54_PORTR|nr:hypothetical protein [Portunus trituberculatus]